MEKLWKTSLQRTIIIALVFALALALLVDVTDAHAALTTQQVCEVLAHGIWMGSTPDDIDGKCWTQWSVVTGAIGCLPGQWAVGFSPISGAVQFLPGSCQYWTTPEPTYGMERKGLCKLMDIVDAFLGGTVTATIKGRPSTLKLKADGKTYVLPIVPGSVVANGDGTYTAQFYTLDPVTGQALVPAGEYTARCHGANGSNDGGSANTVTIGY